GWDASKTYTLSVLAGDATLEQAASIMAENLREVGINVNVQMLDLGTLIERIVSMEYDFAILTISITPVNPLPDIAYYVGPGNPNAYENERVNEILASLGQETNEDTIKALYDELQVILQDETPIDRKSVV